MQACIKQRTIERLERDVQGLQLVCDDTQGRVRRLEKELAGCEEGLRTAASTKQQILAEADSLQMKHQTAEKRLAEAMTQLNRFRSPLKKEERVLIAI